MNISRKFKVIISVFVLTVLFLMQCGLAYAIGFNDTDGHWAKSVIEIWADKGVISGYDGYFYPDDEIIRGDFAIIVSRVANYNDKAENVFLDLDDEEYYADAVLKLYKNGIMIGNDGFVRPTEPITREEAFVMLDRVYKFKSDNKSIKFIDKNEISDFAYPSVLAMCGHKLISGDNNLLMPQKSITRAEIVKILDNIKNCESLKSGLTVGDNKKTEDSKDSDDENITDDSENDASDFDKKIIDSGTIVW